MIEVFFNFELKRTKNIFLPLADELLGVVVVKYWTVAVVG
jgi:hypothetical protein